MDLLSNKIDSFFQEKIAGLQYTNQTIHDKEFENCTFEKCIFIECEWKDCHFVDCQFIDCSLSAIKPFNTQCTNIQFRNSKVMGFDWTKAKSLRLLSFTQCDLSYSNFSFTKIASIKLIECVAKEINFGNADMSGGIFTKTDFSDSVFSATNLTKTDFRRAYNYGIDFHFNAITKAKFSLPEAASLLKSLDIELEE